MREEPSHGQKDGQTVILYSPSMWAWAQQSSAVPVDSRCVNEGGRRDDGTICRDEAELSGWCKACADELFPS